jgi:predicted metal-dependent hydrolase
VRAALIDWYKRNASRKLPERVAHWASKLDAKAPEVLLTEPRKRWGSSSPSGTIRVNWRIVQAPMSLVDYVVAHELTHLRHPDHTSEFWRTLERVMPDYVTRKTTLRALGPDMEW